MPRSSSKKKGKPKADGKKAVPGGDNATVTGAYRHGLAAGLLSQGIEAEVLGVKSCGHCGATEGTLQVCGGCKNIYFCSRECQRSAWGQHKEQCEAMKALRKNAKKEHGRLGKKSFLMTDATCVGSVAFNYDPTAVSMLMFSNVPPGMEGAVVAEGAEAGLRRRLGPGFDTVVRQLTAQKEGKNSRTEIFAEVDDLHASHQFFLACGPLNDIARAMRTLPVVLAGLRGYPWDQCRILGAGFSPLEWAARKGNFEICQWLATDPRTKSLVTVGAPVAWACYTNHILLAKMLVSHGADSKARDIVSYMMPPIHLAAESGLILAVKWLVEDQGHDIFERHPDTNNNIRSTIRRLPPFGTMPELDAIDSYAQDLGVPIR